MSKYTTFVDPPEVLLAKKQGQIVSDVRFSWSAWIYFSVQILLIRLFFYTYVLSFASSSMPTQKNTSSSEVKVVSLHILLPGTRCQRRPASWPVMWVHNTKHMYVYLHTAATRPQIIGVGIHADQISAVVWAGDEG